MRAKLAGVCLIAAALALVATSVPAQDGAPTTITDIRQESNERSTRLVVQCTGPIAYTYYSPDPLTLVVDIPEVDASQVPARIDVGTREVDSIRITSLARADGRNLARVEVRLASLVPYQIFSKDRHLNLVFEQARAAAAATRSRSPRRRRCALVMEPEPAPAAARRRRRRRFEAAARAGVAAPGAAPRRAPGDAHRRSGPRVRAARCPPSRCAVTVASSTRTSPCLDPTGSSSTSPDVAANDSFRLIEVNEGPVQRVRLGQFSAASPKVARLVVDLTEKTPYRIVEGPNDVRIVFGEEAAASAPAPAAARLPCAALRSPEPWRRSRRAPLAVAEAAPLPVALEPLSLPPLPEPQMPEDMPGDLPPMPGDESIGTACGQTGDLGTPDQPGLQGRRPAGHLPAVRRHLRSQRGRQPGREREGDPQAERGSLGPGARAHPEDQQPRLRPRGQRHPDRPALRARA